MTDGNDASLTPFSSGRGRLVPRSALAPPSMAMDRAQQQRHDEMARTADVPAWVEHCLKEARLPSGFRAEVVALITHLCAQVELPRPRVDATAGQVNLRWQNGSMAILSRGTVVVSVSGTAPLCTEQPLNDAHLVGYMRKAGFISHAYAV